MAENNAVTKEDLKNILNELWDKVNSRFEASDRKLEEFRGEVNSRFEASDRKSDKRFRRSDRQRQALHKEVQDWFYQLEGKIMNRFDQALAHADEAVEKLRKEETTRLDRQAGVIDNFRLEQLTMGAVQDQIRDELDETTKSHDVEIKDLKRRVTVLEEEAFPDSAGKD